DPGPRSAARRGGESMTRRPQRIDGGSHRYAPWNRRGGLPCLRSFCWGVHRRSRRQGIVLAESEPLRPVAVCLYDCGERARELGCALEALGALTREGAGEKRIDGWPKIRRDLRCDGDRIRAYPDEDLAELLAFERDAPCEALKDNYTERP